MKVVFGIIGGFVLTLAVFGSGLAFAVWLLVSKPAHQVAPARGVAELWTRDARPVDATAQSYERLPDDPGAKAATAPPPQAVTPPATETPRTATADAQQLPGNATIGGQVPDPGATAALPPGAPQGQAALPAAHVAWCANRYRSYRPQDNSYRAYSGEMRPCVSPYLDPGRSTSGGTIGSETARGGVVPEMAPGETAPDEIGPGNYPDEQAMDGPPDDGPGWGDAPVVSADHVDYCFNRYRSYRPEDNSYQPFDGGPRRQCE